MKLAKVIGTIWATQKHSSLEGEKLLLIQPVSFSDRTEIGKLEIAVDTVQAGMDDLVYYVTAREASFPLRVKFSPVDAAIIGHVDRIDMGKKQKT